MATATNASPINRPEVHDEAQVPYRKIWSRKRVLLLAAFTVAGMTGLSWWMYASHFETTDDAQVDGHFAQLSSRVSGTVLYVNPLVENDRYVSAGAVLVRLDPRDYQVDLDHARAIRDTRQA